MSVAVFSKIPNLLKELNKVLPSLHFHDVTQGNQESLKDSEILIADFDLLGPHIYDLPKVKWIQGTWAGLDTLLPFVNKPLPYLVTRFSGHHFGQLMAEYVVANIVNQERALYQVNENQNLKDWNHEGKIHNYRAISELNVGILGCGHIGSNVGKFLHMLGATIFAYGRRPTLQQTQENSFISEYFSGQSLTTLLKKSDYVVNILPSTAETKGLLNGNILQHCAERKSVFINIGRGSIIDEKVLIDALNNSWISSAILDVFQIEPLCKESPLWTHKQVKITPHVAAISKPNQIAEQFRDNYELYVNNKPISTTVNFNMKY